MSAPCPTCMMHTRKTVEGCAFCRGRKDWPRYLADPVLVKEEEDEPCSETLNP